MNKFLKIVSSDLLELGGGGSGSLLVFVPVALLLLVICIYFVLIGMMAKNIKVKTLKSDQWRIFKQLRLAALEQNPSSFGESLAEARRLSDGEWQARAQKSVDEQERDTLLAFASWEAVGMIFVFLKEGRKVGSFGGLWVKKDFRRKGVGEQLVKKALAWLKDAGAKEVTFWNNAENEASTSLYQKLGFQETGDQKPLDSDPSKLIKLMRKEI